MEFDNPGDAVRAFLSQAQSVQNAAEQNADRCAALLVRTNLRGVSSWHLKKLKKLLANYNMHTERRTA